MSKRQNFENTAAANSPELQETLQQLNYLRHHESPRAFRKDLALANETLQRDGVLPDTRLVTSRHGFQLRAQRGQHNGEADNPPAPENYVRSQRGGYTPAAYTPTDYAPGFTPANYAPDGYGAPDPAGRRGMAGRNPYLYSRSDFDQQRYGNMPPEEQGSGVHYGEYKHRSRGFDPESTSYDGAHGTTFERARQNARIVAEVARRRGIPEDLAVATMLVESRGNERARGDHGHSIGLMQLNDRGEGYGVSYADKIDPVTNSDIALSEFQRRQGMYADYGDWAAGAQRPKNPRRYAQKIREMLPYAQRILET